MKSVFRNSALFLLLTITISNLTGCSGPAASNNGTAEAPAKPDTNAQADPEEAKKNPNYRPIEKSVDQAEIKNLDGSVFHVADKRGKVILLNMWATWCGPCRSEMPALVRMQEEHRDLGFEVIGLNTDDETVEDINTFAAQMKLNYTLVWADTALQKALLGISNFGGIPQSFIIDREGNLRGVFRGANPADIKKMEALVELVVSE